jgi:hypothetical protein
MARGVSLFAIGFVVWAISWFVSPHELISASKAIDGALSEALEGMEATLRGLAGEDSPLTSASRPSTRSASSRPEIPTGGPPGWRAFRFSWDLLTGRTEGDDAVKQKILGATGLTNLLMLVGLLALLMGGRGSALGGLLLGCAALNLSWLYLTDADFRSGLEAGYWMWVGSFVLAGAGLVRRGGRG